MTPQETIQDIATKRGLLVENVLSKSRNSELVAARKEIILTLHNQGQSASAISRFLGYKDHTVCLYHLKVGLAKTNLAK